MTELREMTLGEAILRMAAEQIKDLLNHGRMRYICQLGCVPGIIIVMHDFADASGQLDPGLQA